MHQVYRIPCRTAATMLVGRRSEAWRDLRKVRRGVSVGISPTAQLGGDAATDLLTVGLADAMKEHPPHESGSVRVLLVDDHCLVREGLATVLQRDERIDVIASVGSGEEAIAQAERLLPHLIIMDLVLPVLNGIDATRRILASLPQTRIVALSACHTDGQVRRALEAGALGFVLKSAAGGELLLAVAAVLAGQRYVSMAVDAALPGAAPSVSSMDQRFARLSTRERDVLRRIVAGSTSADIARDIFLSPKTIDTYRGRIMAKLGVANRSALIRLSSNYELPLV